MLLHLIISSVVGLCCVHLWGKRLPREVSITRGDDFFFRQHHCTISEEVCCYVCDVS